MRDQGLGSWPARRARITPAKTALIQADATRGEVGRAVVVLRDGHRATEAELLAHLDGRLARYKIPKSVVFAGQLPHTASGKLAKPALRHAYGVTAQRGNRS